jgi:hypothetical protein
MNAPISQTDIVTQSVLFRIQHVVNGQLLAHIRSAVIGGEQEMLQLLSLLPGYPVCYPLHVPSLPELTGHFRTLCMRKTRRFGHGWAC